MCIFGWLILVLPPHANAFDCQQAKTKTEQMICDPSSPFGFIKSQDDELDIAYQWALMRIGDTQKLIGEQRQWLKDTRNTCPDRDCLAKAYRERLETLKERVRKPGCYTLQPIVDGQKVKPIEPVCTAMEKNLNQFCDQPPMACGLKIAPEFRQQITLPEWTPLDARASRGLIEEFIRAPWQDATSLSQQEKDALWEEDRPEIEQALAEKRLSFSSAQLDLYNLGQSQKAYRLDLGDCESKNADFANPKFWGEKIDAASIRIQFAPEVAKPLFDQYFTVEKTIFGNAFIFAGKTYSYYMHGKANYVNEDEPPAENWLEVFRNETWTNPGNNKISLSRDYICNFNYQPTQGVSK